jgi:hypothetical protein
VDARDIRREDALRAFVPDMTVVAAYAAAFGKRYSLN